MRLDLVRVALLPRVGLLALSALALAGHHLGEPVLRVDHAQPRGAPIEKAASAHFELFWL